MNRSRDAFLGKRGGGLLEWGECTGKAASYVDEKAIAWVDEKADSIVEEKDSFGMDVD